MNTEQLEKFKALNNKLVEDLVNMYNQSMTFCKSPDSLRGARKIRKCYSTLKHDIYDIANLTKLVYKEAYENRREEKIKEREKKRATVRKTIKENPNAHKPPKRTI